MPQRNKLLATRHEFKLINESPFLQDELFMQPGESQGFEATMGGGNTEEAMVLRQEERPSDSIKLDDEFIDQVYKFDEAMDGSAEFKFEEAEFAVNENSYREEDEQETRWYNPERNKQLTQAVADFFTDETRDYDSQEAVLAEGFLGIGSITFSVAVDATLAVPSFTQSKRLWMPVGIMDSVVNQKAIKWNKDRHPRSSGVDPGHIRTDLARYVDFGAIEILLEAHNRNNRNPAISMGSGPIDAVFVEAVHQFQAKCFFETNQIDGKVGEATLDNLGIVKRSGMNSVDRLNPHARERLRLADAAVTTGNEFSANNWFKGMVNPSFLGWRFTNGIHTILARKLRKAERFLLSLPQYDGLTPIELGRALGFNERNEIHRGARPTKTNASMHTYGLATDILYNQNPWVRGGRFTEILKRAALLISGFEIGARKSQIFFSSLGQDSALSTAEVYDAVNRRNNDFMTYLQHSDPGLIGGLRLAILLRQSLPGILNQGETIAQAAARWQGLIQYDLAWLRDNQVSPFRIGTSARFRDPLQGFLNLHKDLVIALRDHGCLAWGAVDIGTGDDGSGDIMHFDARACGIGDSLAQVGRNSRVEHGHPCLPCAPAGSEGAAGERELKEYQLPETGPPYANEVYYLADEIFEEEEGDAQE